jgi:hypothetical protein
LKRSDGGTTTAQRADTAAEHQRAAQRGAEKANERAAVVESETIKLRERYPWAIPPRAGLSEYARAAVNLRRELAEAFPGIRFTVRSDSGSMTNSVNIGWELGPTTDQVDAIANKYQEGNFNGMEDIYEYDRRPEADAAGTVLGHTKYVITSRSIPDSVRERCARDLCELQHVAYVDRWTKHVYGQGDTEAVERHVYVILSQTAFATGEEYAGLRQATADDGPNYREPYAVRKTAAAPPQADTAPAEPTSDGPTVTINAEKCGVEVRFPTKPDQGIIDGLKGAGWRWSRFSACWYHRDEPAARAFAANLCGQPAAV